MLRNPEIILQCISNVILFLSIDLSKYALDIGKNFAGIDLFVTMSELNSMIAILFSFSLANLYSKNDNTRDEAADGLLKLANKCSDVNGLDSLLKHLFNVFHGSEGKLTLASQKISVLEVCPVRFV